MATPEIPASGPSLARTFRGLYYNVDSKFETFLEQHIAAGGKATEGIIRLNGMVYTQRTGVDGHSVIRSLDVVHQARLVTLLSMSVYRPNISKPDIEEPHGAGAYTVFSPRIYAHIARRVHRPTTVSWSVHEDGISTGQEQSEGLWDRGESSGPEDMPVSDLQEEPTRRLELVRSKVMMNSGAIASILAGENPNIVMDGLTEEQRHLYNA